MWKWVASSFGALAVTAGCLMGMGVANGALAHVLLAIMIMLATAFLIAWPFLKGRTPPHS